MHENKYQNIYWFFYLLQRMDQAIYSSTKVTLWLWLEIPRDEGTLSLKNTITLFMFLSNIWNWKDQSRFMYFCVPFQTMEKYIVYLVKEFLLINMYIIFLFVTIRSSLRQMKTTINANHKWFFKISKIKKQDQTRTKVPYWPRIENTWKNVSPKERTS